MEVFTALMIASRSSGTTKPTVSAPWNAELIALNKLKKNIWSRFVEAYRDLANLALNHVDIPPLYNTTVSLYRESTYFIIVARTKFKNRVQGSILAEIEFEFVSSGGVSE